MMQKSTHTDEYKELLKLLVEERDAAGLRQSDIGRLFAFGQPGISKIEHAERRIDVIELRVYCRALGMTLPEFVGKLEDRLARLGDGGGS